MLDTVPPFVILWVTCSALYSPLEPFNDTRSTLAGIAEYRSALSLDWMAAEDLRQRELALAFQTEPTAPVPMLASDCINYGKPASGKVARLMLELLKNLEGDDGTLIPELIQALLRTKLLVETSLLEAEPDLDSLVKTPGIMMGEPHTTFPRILALTWIAATDPITVKKIGWCPINRLTKYLVMTRPVHIANHMRNLDPVITRARYIMEDFIQHVTPNIYVNDLELAKMNSALNNQPIRPSRPPKYRIQPLKKIRRKDRYPRLDTMKNEKPTEELNLHTLVANEPRLPEMPPTDFSLEETNELRAEGNGARMPGFSTFLLILIVL